MEFWDWMETGINILILRTEWGYVEERARRVLLGSYSPRTQKNNNGTRDNDQHIIC